jgi:hypothetical protein
VSSSKRYREAFTFQSSCLKRPMVSSRAVSYPVLNCNRQVSIDGFRFYVVNVAFFEHLSGDLAAPPNFVYAVLNVSVQNGSQTSARSPKHVFLLLAPGGEKYRPDSNVTKRLDPRYISQYLDKAKPFDSDFIMEPGKGWYETYAAYIIPKGEKLKDIKVVFPEKTE